MDTDADAPMATTAYGAKMPVPTNVDVVIAGTSCVDYSNQNNYKKGLEDGGESGDTYYGLLAFCRNHRPTIVILENVVSADWDRMRELYRDIGYDVEGVIVDTKHYYLPQTRQRGYMVCFDKARPGANPGAALKWQTLMEKLKRRASSPVSSFLTPNDAVSMRQTAHMGDTINEVDWSACEITQMQYRHEERLGTGRPFTNWQEGGTMSVPERGNPSWWFHQVERVKDFRECAVLRKALPKNGMYDAQFKHRIWDVSQNIHRQTDSNPFGIIGCITPSGEYYVSDLERALTAEERLRLQGLPIENIYLTTEAPSQIKDLGGNAMSTPVVGAAFVASIICAGPLLDLGSQERKQESLCAHPSTVTGKFEGFQIHSRELDVDFPNLVASARKALRRCFCESNGGMAEKQIQQCVHCYILRAYCVAAIPRTNIDKVNP